MPSSIDSHDSRPPLLFVPGMDGTGELFYRQVPGLSASYRVLTTRLRDNATSMDELVADLRRTLDESSQAGEPAVLFGESFGGTLALSFAIAHPERVRALVILNSFPWFAPQRRLRLAIAAIRIMPWGTMRLVRRLTAWRLHSRHIGREEMRRFLELTRGTTREGYLNRLRILTGFDARARLGEVTVPTLLLAADRDHLIPSVRQAERMAAGIPDSTLRVLEGHGHACLLARDVDLHAILAQWPALQRRLRAS